MYSKQETVLKIREVGRILKTKSFSHNDVYDNLLKEVHRYVRLSNLTYTEAYIELKGIANTQQSFNDSMQRVRNTIYDRDHNEE